MPTAAPTPGGEPGAQTFVITTPTGTDRLCVADLGPADARLVRKETGLPLRAFIGGEDSIDLDSVAVLIWLARRKQGHRISIDEVESEIGSYDDIAGNVTVEVVEEDDGDDPLSSGAG